MLQTNRVLEGSLSYCLDLELGRVSHILKITTVQPPQIISYSIEINVIVISLASKVAGFGVAFSRIGI